MGYVPMLLLGGVALFFFWALWQQNQFKGFVNNAVLVTFITAHGTSYDKVLPVQGDTIMPPTGKWFKKSDKDKNWGEYKLPKQTYTVMYPLGGWPKQLKVEVKRVFMLETDANTWEAIEKVASSGMTPQAYRANRNPAIVASLLRPDGDTVKGALQGGGGSPKNVKYVLWAQIATIGLIVVLGVLCFLIYTALSGHIAAWGA